MKKIILIIIDGLGDKPIPQLGNRTPLEAAKTPNLDWLIKNGICGQIQPFQFPWQKFPESDTCHLALFGYNPKKYYLGRGVYEAVGVGADLKRGDIALRANFATVDSNLKIIDRRAGRIDKTQPLINSLDGTIINGVRFLLKKSISHRAVLILRGKNLSKEITDGDPHEVGEKARKIKPKTKKAEFTARVLNEFLERAHQILQNHPLNKKRLQPPRHPPAFGGPLEKKRLLVANYLLVRGAGQFKKTPSFRQKYKLSSCCIAGGNLYKGIAKILGMDSINVKGANSLATTNLKGKISAVKKALKKLDFIFCHIKAADNLAEDGNFLGKKAFIEKIDRNLKPILGLKNILIVVTADHSTCCSLKRHCSEPVPILICGSKTETDGAAKFSERVCSRGKLGKIKGLGLMPKILLYSQ